MSTRTHILAGLTLAIGGMLLVAACSETRKTTGPSPIAASGATSLTSGVLDLNHFEICKVYSGVVGPPVVFNITVDIGNNGSVNQTFTRTLSNNQCAEIHGPTDISGGTFSDLVTVTEQVPPGYTVSWVKTQQFGANVQTSSGNTATASGLTVDTDGGALIIFTNTSAPDSGRFTGGGNLELSNGIVVSNGLTMHCDKILSNNINVVWKDLNDVNHHFHLEDHLTTISCIDTSISQPPPAAPLDTMVGTGTGTFDNQSGYSIEFTFIDGGEGSGAIDRIALRIFQGGNVVLNFPLTDIIKGNLQAHFDQPHK